MPKQAEAVGAKAAHSLAVALRFLTLGLLMIATAAALGQRLGQTREQILAENGPATEENHSKGTAVYRRGPLKIDIVYKGGIASSLVVTALDGLNEPLIARILASNGSGTWREMQISGPTRIWQNSSFAQAKCDRVNPRSISLSSGFRSAIPAANQAARPPIAQNEHHSVRSGHSVLAKSPAAAAPDLSGFVGKMFTTVVLIVVPGAAVALLATMLRRGQRESRRSAHHLRYSREDVRHEEAPGGSPVRSAPPPLPPIDLDTMGWENFELLTGEVFRRKGYEVELTTGLGADGGKDLVLRKDGKLVLVQCKNLSLDNRVTAAQMRDFFGLLTAEGATGGYFVTTGYFSADAQKFAAAKPIKLLERADVERLIKEVSKPGENLCNVSSWIDTFAAGAKIVDPLCPRCDQPMKLRRGALGRLFWGCAEFPRCKGKREGREELLQARQWQGS